MPRPVHFELAADDIARAISFYENVFGWRFEKWAGPMEYWIITTGAEDEPGIDGGLGLKSEGTQSINTLDVPDVDAAVAAIVANGGAILMPKQTIPGVGYLAYCQDTEGNSFGVMQSDMSAS
jgi:uncharacterized protein